MWAKVLGGSAVGLFGAAGATLASSRWNSGDPPSVMPRVSAAEPKEGKPSLAGKWQNDLGSKMVLEEPDASGFFRGTYLTKVSSAEKPIQISPLWGARNATDREDEEPTFGFTVGWTFSDSTAVFVGQRFTDADGEEALKTVWLLREKMEDPKDDWKATKVGHNVFKRISSA